MGEGRTLVVNRQARFSYEILETAEAGLALLGSEVKSIREGKASIRDAYADVRGGEAFLVGAHVDPYEQAGRQGHDPLRERKLLLHAREIRRLDGKIQEKGLTLIPLRIYLSGRRVKVEIALAKGKKVHDKREAIKKRDVEREMRRELSRKHR